jgi:hypothetical protein
VPPSSRRLGANLALRVCQFYVNIVQDYAGGSSYGDSTANFIKSEPAGCK